MHVLALDLSENKRKYPQLLSATPVKAQGPLRCDLHEVVVTSNDDWSVFDNVKDLRGIYEGDREVEW